LSGKYIQGIQVGYCKIIRFKSVRWHDGGSYGYTLGVRSAQCISWRPVIFIQPVCIAY